MAEQAADSGSAACSAFRDWLFRRDGRQKAPCVRRTTVIRNYGLEAVPELIKGGTVRRAAFLILM